MTLTASQLFGLRAATHQWPAALQAALALVIPPSLGFAVGQQQLGSVASVGALIVLHLPDRSRRDRARALPVVGAAMLLAASLGALVGGSLLPVLLAMSALAVVGSFIAQAASVGPPGALFLVLACGTAGQLVKPTRMGGAGLSTADVVVALGAGVLVGYLVVVTPLAVPSVRRADAELHSHRVSWAFTVTPSVRVVTWRIALASLLAVPVSAALGLHHASWVLLACLGILQKDASISAAVVRGVQRIIGTTIAIVVIIGLALIDPQGPARMAWAAVLIFTFELLLRRNLTWAMAAVTPMAVLLGSASGQSIADIAGDRVLDTACGAGVAGAVLLSSLLGSRIRKRGRG